MMKKYSIFIIIILLIISYDVIKTYSLFESNITVPTELSLANWEISVNDSTIGTNAEFDINEIIWDESSVVADGKAAPGRTGYFNISIKPNNTKVAYRYDIEIQDNSTFEILSVVPISGASLVKTSEKTYSSIVTLEDIDDGVENKLKINVIWNNNEYNNDLDTKLSEENAIISVPVSIHFIQYNGEELIEYIE